MLVQLNIAISLADELIPLFSDILQRVILLRAMHLGGLKQPESLMVQLPHHISKLLLNV